MTRWTDLVDAGARATFAAYFAKVDRALAALPRSEAEEIKAELEAHALDAFAASGEATSALSQLGDTDDFLPALVADRLRARAGRTFNPGDIAAALMRSAGAGIAGLATTVAAGLGYAVAVICVALGIVKFFAPHGTGVYRLDAGGIFIGSDANVQGVDLVGMWFSPLAIAVGVCLYVVLTWTFGRATVRKRAPLGCRPMED